MEPENINSKMMAVPSRKDPQWTPKLNLPGNLLSDMGTLQTGGITVPLGLLLRMLKSQWPINKPENLISGSVQRYRDQVHLVMCVQSKFVDAWTDDCESHDDACILDLMRSMDFRIYKYFMEDCPSKTVEGFKFYTETISSFIQYNQIWKNQNGRNKYLNNIWENYRNLEIIEPLFGIDPGLLRMLGFTYHDNNDYSKSVEIFRNAYKMDGKFEPNILALMFGGLGESLKVMARANMEMSSQRSTWNEEAVKAYRRAIDLTGDVPDAAIYYSGLGYVYMALERTFEAISAFKHAIKLNPEVARYHASLAGLYRRQKEYEDKYHRQIDLACKLLKEREEGYEYNRAWIESINGNTDEALKWLEKALEKKQVTPLWARLDPDFEFIHHDPRFMALLKKAEDSYVASMP